MTGSAPPDAAAGGVRADGTPRCASAIGPDGLFLLAEVEGEIAGFVLAAVAETTPEEELEVVPGRWGRVTELFVREGFRSQGVGSELMARAEDFCRRHGCTTVRVEVFAPNRLAHRFYRGLGYADRDIDLLKPCDRDERKSPHRREAAVHHQRVPGDV